ncbi:hypothetical protein HYALB_00011411 [Hymenoscyphus albidus]|uniref:Uncharacterized protein n=1 Tax=Hymenoscyphus albidus TaxID=595503 RepID=A0A9N9LJ97_9HELO|nr:hypothetical protein HYALB_00011411 [Hymenoscyphus albidus]
MPKVMDLSTETKTTTSTTTLPPEPAFIYINPTHGSNRRRDTGDDEINAGPYIAKVLRTKLVIIAINPQVSKPEAVTKTARVYTSKATDIATIIILANFQVTITLTPETTTTSATTVTSTTTTLLNIEATQTPPVPEPISAEDACGNSQTFLVANSIKIDLDSVDYVVDPAKTPKDCCLSVGTPEIIRYPLRCFVC